MAESAVIYVFDKLVDALQKKAKELYTVSGQIEQMQKELRLIQALLKDADSKRNKDELVNEWVNQVRDMAHKIEDSIDTFLVEIEENGPENSHLLGKVRMAVKNPIKLYKLGGELKEITQHLKIIYQHRTDLGITVLGAAGSEDNVQLLYRPTKPSDVDDSEVVGLESDKHEIIKQLLDRNISRRSVLSIVGPGGLGKTTLAQKLYKSAELEGQFDCRAWLSISQKFNLNDLMRKILYSIEPQMKNKNPPITNEDLPDMLMSSLGCKRYLIILDDVWDIDLWEQLEIHLPDPKNASRVIITSRLCDVASAADCNTEPYILPYLNEDESLSLLFRKAFQQHIQPENYSGDLLIVATKLIKKCGGLPLALVVLGGILRKRGRTYNAWNTVERTLNWHNEDGERCMKILAMSYEDLPYYLKPCFLYFSSFPQDFNVSGRHVTRMWIAEGFIPKDGAGTMEDRAEEFLEELVQRCMIQVTKKSWKGYCKYCSMHDLLRDLAIRKAKEENFFTVFSKEDVNQLAARKPRRAALQFCTLTEDGVYSENTRSLLCFGFGENSSNDCGFRLLNYSGFKLLRVLTLERVDMINFTRRQWLKGKIHLRYLGLRDCSIPQDIFEKIFFCNLETIDLKSTRVFYKRETTDLPEVVIPTLRHVYGCTDFERCLPLKWDHHRNLQTVKNVALERHVAKLECCINLRTLGIDYEVYLGNERAIEEWQTLKGVLRRTKLLVFLGISVTIDSFLPFGGTRDFPCHENIQSLHLLGKWGRHICVPSVELFPTNLTKLVLLYTRLQEDPMPIFEKLQSLMILQLGSYSYVETKLICSTGGFPNLKKLQLRNLLNLLHCDIKEGAMPILNHLEISYCDHLHALPELQKVRSLQELIVVDPSRELRQSMQGKDLHKIKHVTSVRIRPESDELDDSQE